MAPRASSDASPSRLWSASHGFWVVWVVHLGRRFGLLDALASSRGPISPATLARRARCDPNATRLWCDAALALRVVRRRGRGIELPRPLAPLFVDPDDPAYFGGHFSYLALRSLDFDAFDELFRHGAVSARPQRHLLEAFAEATRFDHTAFLKILLPRVPALRRVLSGGCEVLDVGAGAGTWELRVAPAFPKSTFVGIEPNRAAVRMAEAQAAREGLDGRVRFVVEKAETMQFNERFAVAYLGEMLCAGNDPHAVLRACSRALKPGGWIVVCEGLVDETRAPDAPGNDVVLPMQLEFALQPARFLGKRELRGLLRAAGFRRPLFVDAGGGLFFAVARR